MADREKVRKGLECCITSLMGECKSDCPYTEDCHRSVLMFDLLCNALEIINRQPQWISVKDRLPDKQPCEYLVVNANNVETAICLDNRWITPRRVIKITHWMPLPEPPEVKQDG